MHSIDLFCRFRKSWHMHMVTTTKFYVHTRLSILFQWPSTGVYCWTIPSSFLYTKNVYLLLNLWKISRPVCRWNTASCTLSNNQSINYSISIFLQTHCQGMNYYTNNWRLQKVLMLCKRSDGGGNFHIVLVGCTAKECKRHNSSPISWINYN